MNLRFDQINSFERDGYLFFPEYFNDAFIDELNVELDLIKSHGLPGKILEKKGKIRSIFGTERISQKIDQLTKSKDLIHPSEQLINSKLYIHQTKFNFKVAFDGDWWDWHQDFIFWHNEDHIPHPRMLTAMIFLDDVTEFNGPLILIPGSHQLRTVDHEQFRLKTEVEAPKDDYSSHVGSDLKYTLSRESIIDSLNNSKLVSIKGKRGSMLFFHCTIFHASSNNLSPWDRKVFMITYNSVSNTPNIDDLSRPDFLANRDFSPILSP